METNFIYRLMSKTATKRSSYHRARATSKAALSNYLRAKYHNAAGVTLEGVYTEQQFAAYLWDSDSGLRDYSERRYMDFSSLPTHVKHVLTEKAKRYVSSTRYVKGITAASSKKAVKAAGIRIDRTPKARTYDGKRFKLYMTGFNNRANAERLKQMLKRDNPEWQTRIEKIARSRSEGGATYAIYVRKRA